jgi:hypothetical protein
MSGFVRRSASDVERKESVLYFAFLNSLVPSVSAMSMFNIYKKNAVF